MFKEHFKYYKSKKPPPDLKNVIDFYDENDIKQVNKLNINNKSNLFGLKPTEEWEVFNLKCHPGLIFIKNPFTPIGQLYFSIKCLKDYTKKPNKSNLDIHGIIDNDEDWWCKASEDETLLQKMRWITFGYHHNWDTKIYSEENQSPFPNDLSILCKFIMKILNFENFQPEAAIVNYYHKDSTLSGHTDHSEQNLEAPLLSISFGQSAIFLLGGKSIDDKPTAMFIHSGDVIVMSRESRLCYHGVPKIVPNMKENWQYCNSPIVQIIPDEFDYSIIKNMNEDRYKRNFENYLKKCRININVRQVLKFGQKRLCID